MRFLDMNIPPSIAAELRAEGHDAIHALDVGLGGLSDAGIFERAREDGRIVITFDLDFGEIAGTARSSGSSVILLRLRRARRSYLSDRLRVAIAEANDALAGGAVVLVEDTRIRIRRTRQEEQG